MSYTNEFLWELLRESMILIINVPLKQKKMIFCHRIMGLNNKVTISETLKDGD